MADGSTPVTDRYFSAAELAGMPGLPSTERNVRGRADRECWSSRPRRGRGGGSEYSFASLPAATQAALILRQRPKPASATERPPIGDARITAAWDAFNAAPDGLKARARLALEALATVDHLRAHGVALMDARAQVAAEFERRGQRGFSVANLGTLAKRVRDVQACDRLAFLLPGYVGRTVEAPIPPAAWDFYIGHYLTRARPTPESTYRRTAELAKAHGWTLPSSATFRRRVKETVPEFTLRYYREGAASAASLLPRGRRDELVFAAGEAVNGDGLKFDRLWVRFADGEILNTATAWFWQDVRTRRILAWRLGKTESTDLFRLATYDLTGVCAPAHAWMDNTLVAANKTMTAGAAGRHRYRADPEDGVGLLLMLGIEPHFTNPDKETGTPGAKPVERAFGIGGIHSEVATHPRIVERGGASKASAVDEALVREVIAIEVARFNARAGREAQACRGILSYDDAWNEGIQQTPLRVLTTSQRQLLLMQREVVRADQRAGLLQVKGGRWSHGQNAFHCAGLAEFLGRKLVVHYDPDDIRAGAHVYTLDGRYLFAAEHQPFGQPFNSTDAGREINKLRQRDLKLHKKLAENAALRSKKERAAMYAAAELPAPPAAPTAPNVVAGHFQRVANPARDAERARTGTDDAAAIDPAGAMCVEIMKARKRRAEGGE